MKNNIIGLTIGAAVAIIVLASVLVPSLADATQTEDTFHNEGLFNYGVFTPEDEYTMTYESTTGIVTANGDVVTPIPGVGPGSGYSYSIIATEDALFRYGHDNNGYYLQVIGKTAGGTNFLQGGVTVTATIEDGLLAVTLNKSDGTTQNATFSFEKMYAIVPKDDVAVMKVRTGDALINSDSEIYSTGLTTVSSWNNAFHFEGTYKDGITISSPNLPGATFENVTWDVEAVEGHNDLYRLHGIEFDIISNGTTTHAAYTYFAVPSEVTAERSNHLSGGEIAILNAIPILVIVAVVIGIAAVALRARD